MRGPIGNQVVAILEYAGRRHLGPSSPLFQLFGLQVGGTTTLLDYDGSRVYWQRVQVLLDAFFSASERTEICADLTQQIDLSDRPEAREFLCQARAELQLGRVLDGLNLGIVTRTVPPGED